ncbi:MAG: pyruvate kinase [Bacilli bacterium]|nr:pyruvate kinase [Bacilli bacterium]
MKKTKIICTVGPQTTSKGMLADMIKAGMDVVRINLSHGDHEFAERIIKNIRNLNKELKTSVGILMDIKGPKVRLVNCKYENIYLDKGNTITLTSKHGADINKFLVSYPDFINGIKVGDQILLDDGLIELKVISVTETDVECEALNGGSIRNNTSVNIPGVDLDLDFLSVADKNDIVFAAKNNVDFIALSFVRNANDILDVNDMLIGLKNEHIQIIAKIENESAIEDIDNIIKVSDGVMIARGDLGVEIPIEQVPGIQKKITSKCFKSDKICIVATQMLSSMQEIPMPTRAEVSDVANAVIDNTDAVMLSGETAIGNYPIKTIEMMAKIITNIEQELDYEKILDSKEIGDKEDITTIIAYNVVSSASKLKADAILVSTISGYTARKVSNFRPICPIITVTPNQEVASSLSLNWGVKPVLSPMFNSTDEIVNNAINTYKDKFETDEGRIIITGGFPMNKERNTNFIKIEEIK